MNKDYILSKVSNFNKFINTRTPRKQNSPVSVKD